MNSAVDIHSDSNVYLEEPVLAVPEKQGTRGRVPVHLKSDVPSVAQTNTLKHSKKSNGKK